MTINLDLALEVREMIKMHPERHSQKTWAREESCGTTMCIAGWACHLSGLDFLMTLNESNCDCGCGAGMIEALKLKDGREVDHAAADLLGLDRHTASSLFYTVDNDAALDMLDRLIEEGKNAR